MKKKTTIKRLLWIAAGLFAIAIISHIFELFDPSKTQDIVEVTISDLSFLVGLVTIMCIYFYTEAYSGRIINMILAILFVLFAWPYAYIAGIGGIFVFASAIFTMIAVSIQLSLPTEIESYSNPDLLDDFK